MAYRIKDLLLRASGAHCAFSRHRKRNLNALLRILLAVIFPAPTIYSEFNCRALI
ncbi:hypothetical protein LA76x_4924 [Lysobacter antibioticus]|uniref:Uncharacterized protein n=1 Tax=Lysobacter antibioticus TaxID=84531 RepID=A0A0S2FHV9_LYSAN|nr:hypothetical protein LA76x_4924 [Lysobacter antibioticus]